MFEALELMDTVPITVYSELLVSAEILEDINEDNMDPVALTLKLTVVNPVLPNKALELIPIEEISDGNVVPEFVPPVMDAVTLPADVLFPKREDTVLEVSELITVNPVFTLVEELGPVLDVPKLAFDEAGIVLAEELSTCTELDVEVLEI